MSTLEKFIAFVGIVAFFVLIGFALRTNARAHGDGKGEA